MSPVPSERKSWGPLIATIDLLFLVVAFFTLLLFFVQKERQHAQVRLSQVEETLANAVPSLADAPEQHGNALVTLVERLMTLQKREQNRQLQVQQREELRHTRPIARINYEVRPGGAIVYDGRTLTPREFKADVIDPARKTSWLAIRAYAPPETPFGDVVAMRKLLLENGAEFDTYWDNLAEAGAPSPAGNSASSPTNRARP
jgi:hypothetical protein